MIKITSRQIAEISVYLADRTIDRDKNIELIIDELGNGVIHVCGLSDSDYYFDRDGEFPEGIIL